MICYNLDYLLNIRMHYYLIDRIEDGFIRHDGPGGIDGKKKYYAYDMAGISFLCYKQDIEKYSQHLADII